mgnify:CR=1 FL=1
MRCKNCGWPNKPNETFCVKCNTPLEREDEGTLKNNFAFDNSAQKTVMETDAFDVNAGQNNQCPKCGYPVRSDAEKCPNCNYLLKSRTDNFQHSYRESPANNNFARRPTKVGATPANNKLKGTVNPYMMNMEDEPVFILKPVKKVNERHDLEEIEYFGKEVILTRENTEANNFSITSKEQAVLSKIDGKWYIEDKSEQKTTFVQASKRIAISDGDIILLGNRLFEFHE